MSSAIRWFTQNPVAANLIMLLLIIGGASSFIQIGKESQPSPNFESVNISIAYPSAGPEEIEEKVITLVEEAIFDLEDIKRLRSIAQEGFATITAEAVEDSDMQKLVNEIKARVDGISSFPSLAERPQVSIPISKFAVMSVAIAGDMSEIKLKQLTQQVRNEIAELPGVGRVDLNGLSNIEVSIEVNEHNLQKYGLSFDDIAQAISQTSVNVSAGEIESDSGNMQIMARGQRYKANDFENIVLITDIDGSQVLLKSVAKITNGFSNNRFSARINGKKGVLLMISTTQEPNVVKVSQAVNHYLEHTLRPRLPVNVEAMIWFDNSLDLASRSRTLLSNGISGLVLVFLGLMLFLTPRLAAWVVAGIAVSFLGAFILLPTLGITLNMISLFAFILVLGIVVDDAIIVGESIHRENQSGIYGAQAASNGVLKVARPVIYSAITTMIFFLPGINAPGLMKPFAFSISIVVILTLVFSLIECLLILPSHLRIPQNQPTGILQRFFIFIGITHYVDLFRKKSDQFLQTMIYQYYLPLLDLCLQKKGITLSLFLSMLIITNVGLIGGGKVGYAFVPNISLDYIHAKYSFQKGTPYSTVEKAALELQLSADKVIQELEMLHPDKKIVTAIIDLTEGNNAQAYISLEPSENRPISAEEITKMWRKHTPVFSDAKDISFANSLSEFKGELLIRLSSPDKINIKAASLELKAHLATYDSIYFVTDTNESAQTEAVLSLKPGAENLGISLGGLGKQVRQAFYGEEVQRITRGSDEVKVFLRYPQTERSSIDNLYSMRVRSGSGEIIPFDEIATVDYQPALTAINRTDRKRTLTIKAYFDEGQENQIKEVIADLNKNFLPKWQEKFPETRYVYGGGEEDENDFVISLLLDVAKGIVVIYVLFAIAFRSYFKPFIIFTALPFGLMGAILGHLFLGLNLSVFSIMGIMAALGVVINDNLVLLDFITQLRREGKGVVDAVVKAAEQRFRAIFLTSFTTFIGLIPLMLETSVQAQFLIPTAVSLAFGVLFASFVTLLMVPTLYIQMSQIKDWLYGLRPLRERSEF